MARNLAMTVLMNVDIYDKTKYLESAVFVFVRGVILSISVIQCDHNIDITPSLGCSPTIKQDDSDLLYNQTQAFLQSCPLTQD